MDLACSTNSLFWNQKIDFSLKYLHMWYGLSDASCQLQRSHWFLCSLIMTQFNTWPMYCFSALVWEIIRLIPSWHSICKLVISKKKEKSVFSQAQLNHTPWIESSLPAHFLLAHVITQHKFLLLHMCTKNALAKKSVCTNTGVIDPEYLVTYLIVMSKYPKTRKSFYLTWKWYHYANTMVAKTKCVIKFLYSGLKE